MTKEELAQKINEVDRLTDKVSVLLPHTPYNKKCHDELLKSNTDIARIVLLTDFLVALQSRDFETALKLYNNKGGYRFTALQGDTIGKELAKAEYKQFKEYKHNPTPTTESAKPIVTASNEADTQTQKNIDKVYDVLCGGIEEAEKIPNDEGITDETIDNYFDEVGTEEEEEAEPPKDNNPIDVNSHQPHYSEVNGKRYITRNFQCADFGIIKYVQNQKGETSTPIVSNTRMYIDTVYEDVETHKRTYKLNYLQGGKWKSQTVIATALASKSELIQLSHYGIDANSNNSRDLIDYFRMFTNEHLNKLEVKQNCSHMGWLGKDFIPYDSKTTLIDNDETRLYIDTITTKGSKATQLNTIRKYVQNEMLCKVVFGAMVGSVLISPLGGKLPYVLHLWGGTGNGKTTLCQMALAMFGNPTRDKALFLTMDGSEKSITRTCTLLGSLPHYRDDLQLIKDVMSYDKFIMKVAEGKGYTRLNIDGTLKPTGSWNCATITTGEEPILKYNSGGGVYNRTFEFETTYQLFNGEFEEVYNSIFNNYGHIGKPLIEGIKSIGTIALNKRFSAIRNDLNIYDAEAKQKDSMAIILLGWEILNEVIFDNELKPLKVEEVAPFMHSVKELKGSYRAMQFIRNYISQNRNHFEDNITENWGRITTNGVSTKAITVDFDKYKLIDALAKDGYNFDAVKKDWAKWGFLIKDKRGNKERFDHWLSINGTSASYFRLDLSKEILQET